MPGETGLPVVASSWWGWRQGGRWSETESAVISSGDSELYVMSAGAAEALGFREFLTDIGLPTTVRLRCDSTAAIGIATRQARFWPYEARAGSRSCYATLD